MWSLSCVVYRSLAIVLLRIGLGPQLSGNGCQMCFGDTAMGLRGRVEVWHGRYKLPALKVLFGNAG